MKKCPYCAEEIQDDAILCRYCGKDLTKPIQLSQPEPQPVPEVPKEQPKKKNYLAPLIVAVLIVCAVLWLAMQSTSPNLPDTSPTMTEEEKAWYTCLSFVEEELKVSSGNAQKFAPERVRNIAVGQYVVDIYYASLGTTYRCEMKRTSSTNWQIRLTER